MAANCRDDFQWHYDPGDLVDLNGSRRSPGSKPLDRGGSCLVGVLHSEGSGTNGSCFISYLLSPQTSPVGGVGLPGGRVVLYGAPSPLVAPSTIKDSDPLIFSEIVEFALSLTPPAKGQDAFMGLPHLQAYRLLHASNLAELGHVSLANRCARRTT